MSVMNYRELIVWQKAMDLADTCFKITASFPRVETYGLTAQIQRSATDIPSEIAHGQGRATTRDFLWHLGNANGRRCQLETQLMLAYRAGHLTEEALKALLERCAEVGRLLTGLTQSLERKLDS
jgi:four helix bundle protein